jgi:Fic family protein
MKRDNSGEYVTSTYGKEAPAFIPADLPPTPPIRPDLDTQNKISEINRMMGALNRTMRDLPDTKAFVSMYVRYEASRSSQIEGIETTVESVLDFEVQQAIEADPKHKVSDVFEYDDRQRAAEVRNHINAIYRTTERLNEKPFSKRLLRYAHKQLMSGDVRGSDKRPGQFRERQNYIGARSKGPENAEHIPPPPHRIENLMDNLESFVHDRTGPQMPPIIKAGIAHVQFETIHPFLDGNGRVGRLMVPLILQTEGALSHPIYYLSEYFNRHKQTYFEKLSSASYEGDWEAWLAFFAEGLIETSRRVRRRVDETTTLYKETVKTVENSNYRMTDNTREGLTYLFQQPKFSLNQMENDTGITYQSARNVVDRFRDLGLVEEVSGRSRGKVFSFEAYMDIFRELERQR